MTANHNQVIQMIQSILYAQNQARPILFPVREAGLLISHYREESTSVSC